MKTLRFIVLSIALLTGLVLIVNDWTSGEILSSVNHVYGVEYGTPLLVASAILLGKQSVLTLIGILLAIVLLPITLPIGLYRLHKRNQMIKRIERLQAFIKFMNEQNHQNNKKQGE